MMGSKQFLLVIFLISSVLFGCAMSGQVAFAAADSWPAGKTITIVVPWKAGGSADLMVRAILPYWKETAGCNFIVDNREGATTMVGSVYFLSLTDDGSFIYSGTQPYISSNQILKGAKYDISDFYLLNMQQVDPTTITVNSSSPYKTIGELAAAIEKNPGKMKVGMTAGGGGEILLSMFKEKRGWNVKIVTYDNGNDFRTALLGGHVDFITSSAAGDLALGDSGRVLAICGGRNPICPDAPSFDEAYPNLQIPGSLGSCRFFAVHKTFKEKYPDRYKKLLETYQAAFNDPGYQEFLQSTGEITVSSIRGEKSSNEMNLQLHALIEKYKDVLKASQ